MTDQMPTSKDYWTDIISLVDEKREIKPDNGKPLDEFLAKKLGLSRPTVRSLLLNWEKQEKIAIERNLLLGRLVKLNLRQAVGGNKILILVDLENLQVNINTPFSLIERIDNIRNQIAKEIGEIINIFVFTPFHLASVYGKSLQDLGVFTIVCPKVRTEKNGEVDTTDETLIKFGEKQISQIPELTHLCIGSGDEHFAPLAEEAKKIGLKIVIIAGNLRSLSPKLIKLAEKKPSGGKSVYFLSPTGK